MFSTKSEGVARDQDRLGSIRYRHRDNEIVSLSDNAAIPITLKVLEHYIFIVYPMEVLGPESKFIPLGLTKSTMILDTNLRTGLRTLLEEFEMELNGCDLFVMHSSRNPRKAALILSL